MALMCVAAAPTGTERYGAWNFRVLTDPMTDAIRGIAIVGADADPISLVVKCDKNGDGEGYLSFFSRQYLGGLRTNKLRGVKYRLDDGVPVEMVAFHDDHSASVIDLKLGTPGASFIGNLSSAKKLVVRLTNFDGDVQTAVIDVTGSGSVLRKVAENLPGFPLG